MKTVVTGGTGFIGSHLVKALIQEGRDVAVASELARPGTPNLDTLGIKQNDIERRGTNLTNYREALTAIAGADVVFHLAACVGSLEFLHGSQNSELNALQTNILIDANVIKACLEKGVKKLIYASSCAVYPMNRQLTSGAIFSEPDLQLKMLDFLRPQAANWIQTEIDPDGGYGWSKLIGELQLSWMNGIDICSARIFNIYGINEPLGDRAHVVGDLMQRVRRHSGKEFVVWGDGKRSRDLLYVTDCVDALLKLENKASNPPTIVNIGSGQATQVRVLVQKIIEISGRDITITFDPAKPAGPVSRTADIAMAKQLLSWEPEVSLDEGLTSTYKWVERRLGR